jgi:glycosidase
MQGYKDPFNRRCFPWGNEDTDMLEYVKQLGKIRKSSKIFSDGTIKFIMTDENVLAFARIRTKNNKALAVFINRSPEKQFVNSISVYENTENYRIIYGAEPKDKGFEIAPYSYAVIKAELS